LKSGFLRTEDKFSMSSVRLDRWLWSSRQFKTRSLATDACKRNWVKVNDGPGKPSKPIRIGDVLNIQKGPLLKTVKVVELLEKRVSAGVAAKSFLDMTPEEEHELAKEKSKRINLGCSMPTVKGRPSKKQRRDLEEFLLRQQD